MIVCEKGITDILTTHPNGRFRPAAKVVFPSVNDSKRCLADLG